MAIQTGLLIVNNVDVYTQYGAFLSEEKAGDCNNYSALLKPASMKPYVAVSFREENGEQLPATLTARSEARDVTLQFTLIAANATTFKTKYRGFIQFLKAGWLNVQVPELANTFRLYFVECSEYKQLTPMTAAEVAASFKIKFREPNPFV